MSLVARVGGSLRGPSGDHPRQAARFLFRGREERNGDSGSGRISRREAVMGATGGVPRRAERTRSTRTRNTRTATAAAVTSKAGRRGEETGPRG